jgi:hypothetical protein
MQRQRPASVLVIAILSFILGAFASCCNIGSVVYPFAEPGLDRAFDEGQNPEQPPAQVNLGKTWEEVTLWALSIVELLLVVLLIISGVGLLRVRPWARKLALVCAGLLVLENLAFLALSIRSWANATDDLPPELGPAGRLLGAWTVYALTVGYTLVWVAFGVTVVLVLLRPSVAAAFRSEPVSRP